MIRFPETDVKMGQQRHAHDLRRSDLRRQADLAAARSRGRSWFGRTARPVPA